jgi:hypothetical protein
MAVTLAEINRIRTQPEAAQRIAKGLIETFPASAFSDRELDFLESIIRFRNVPPDVILGFSVRTLLESCLEARLDLDENDEEWIALQWTANPQAIRRKFMRGHRFRRTTTALSGLGKASS